MPSRSSSRRSRSSGTWQGPRTLPLTSSTVVSATPTFTGPTMIWVRRTTWVRLDGLIWYEFKFPNSGFAKGLWRFLWKTKAFKYFSPNDNCSRTIYMNQLCPYVFVWMIGHDMTANKFNINSRFIKGLWRFFVGEKAFFSLEKICSRTINCVNM